MKKATLIAIIVAVVLIAGGSIAIMMKNGGDSSQTADTIVGHTFEYRVVGNYEDKTITGTQEVSILSEKDDRYEVKTVRNVFVDSSNGTRTVLWDDANTEWKDSTDISHPGTFSEEYKLNTYWGVKDSKVYTSTVNSVKTTSYVLYDKISFETVVEDGDNLYIYMMDDTDFIKESKSVTAHNFGVSFSIIGTSVSKADSNTSYSITGSANMDRIDATGTANEFKTSVDMLFSIFPIKEENTSWTLRDNSNNYGTKSGTSKVSTVWGTLDTTVYVSTEDGQKNTNYLYRDIIPVKVSSLADNESFTQEYAMTLTKMVMDGENIDTIKKLDDFIDKYY